MNAIIFRVVGEPKGQPRPRAFAFHGRARVYNPGTAEGWKSQVAEAAKVQLPAHPLTGPLTVRMFFLFPRPKGHYGSGKNADKLKARAPEYHTGKPDLDNLAKAVLDALKIIGMFKDDSQVAHLNVSKSYATHEQPGCVVGINETGTGSPGKGTNPATPQPATKPAHSGGPAPSASDSGLPNQAAANEDLLSRQEECQGDPPQPSSSPAA